MSHSIQLSDERYQMVESLASALKRTPEELIDILLDRAWEETSAAYDTAFEQDASWIETAREAEANTEATEAQFPTTEALFERLGASEDHLAEARKLDQSASTN